MFRSRLRPTPVLVLLLAVMAPAPAPAQDPAVDPALYGGMHYRMVGPFRGGRTTAVTGIAEQPHTFFMGATGGGLWKTDDAGHHWTPITDGYLAAGAIGAVDVADSSPDVIYLGTGSTCIRGNVSVGKGLYRSRDGGDTWSFIGLPESGAIGEIVVHPEDPDLVYAAALGHPFGTNPERGVYRSRNGGDSWEKVLFLNDSTGAVSLAMNPSDPREIYAGMWRAERKPWTMISGGPEGGLYRTRDGGDSWQKLTGGLPEGIVGKVGVTVSPANPQRVWAMIEAEPGNGLYRSDDGGETWTLLTDETRLTGRAWYYHHVVADPRDQNIVYVLNTRFYRSTDGGSTFELIPVPHGDVHDLWINPQDPSLFVLGDDGGAVVSLNQGRTFSSMYNQPTAELYDVMVDNQIPYRIYGSQQDNTTISVPSRPLRNQLRPQEGWRYAAGCETGPIAFDPDDPDVIWGGCYGGVINRMVVSTDTRRNMNLYPVNQGVAASELRYRFQWVAPIVLSMHDRQTLYHASQYVHRTRDGGTTWETISPDLTTNNPAHQQFPGGPIHADHSGVEVFNTIFALAESPHTPGTLWVGTDDGRVHITRDDGAHWTEITPPSMPELGTVNRIEISPHAPGRAFLAVQRYRMDDWRPYLFRTDDYGRSWRLLTNGRNGIPADHWVRVVREDPARRGLLYAGTEFGVFVSFDDGARWQSLQLDLPTTPITDLKVHRGDLVLSTQGRSFWVLDDLTPLRELAARPRTGVARLFTPRDAARGLSAPPLQEVDLLRPEEAPEGALIQYVLRDSLADLQLEIVDSEGRVAARWESGSPLERRSMPASPGLHRMEWNLAYQLDGGVKAPPGEYRARLSWDGGSDEKSFRVLADPRDPHITLDDYHEQFRVAMEVRRTMVAVDSAVRRLRGSVRQAQEIVDQARADDAPVGRLPELTEGLQRRLRALEAELTAVPTDEGGPGLRSPAGLDRQYGSLMYHLNSGGGYGAGSTEGRPTPGAMQRKTDLDRQWEELRARVEAALQATVAPFNVEAERLGLEGRIRPGG